MAVKIPRLLGISFLAISCSMHTVPKLPEFHRMDQPIHKAHTNGQRPIFCLLCQESRAQFYKLILQTAMSTTACNTTQRLIIVDDTMHLRCEKSASMLVNLSFCLAKVLFTRCNLWWQEHEEKMFSYCSADSERLCPDLLALCSGKTTLIHGDSLQIALSLILRASMRSLLFPKMFEDG